MKKLSLLFVMLFIGGCAFGNTTSYQGYSQGFEPSFEFPPISLAVIDKRPYVLDGTKSPSYCGTTRSLGGVPYNVNTKSGRPLAEMLQGFFGTTLQVKGFSIDNMELLPKEISEEAAAKKLTANGTKAILIFLREWRTHVYFNPIFEYDLKEMVIREGGKILKSVEKKGTIEFGSNKKAKTFAMAVSTVVDELFNNEDIKRALASSREAESATKEQPAKAEKRSPEQETKLDTKKPPCTTEQILKMKDMGMANSQIKAACE